MNINWKIRLMNKQFWLSFVPAMILLVQVVAKALGFELDLNDLGTKLINVINAVFGVLTIVGVVTDPTTKGVSDSARAMTYIEPN